LVLSDLTNQQLHCKLQTRPLVREDTLQKEKQSSFHYRKNKDKDLVMGTKGEPDTKTNWSTDRQP
jgi:hypothetical protein